MTRAWGARGSTPMRVIFLISRSGGIYESARRKIYKRFIIMVVFHSSFEKRNPLSFGSAQ